MEKTMKYVVGVLCVFALTVSLAVAAGSGAEIYAKQCKGCHGADGAVAAMGTARPVKDLSLDETKAALAGYKNGTYGGQKKAMMEKVMKSLSDEDIASLAAYVAGL